MHLTHSHDKLSSDLLLWRAVNISGEATKSSWSIKSSIEKLIVGVKISLLCCSRLMRKLKGKVSVRKSRQKGYCANFRYNFRLLDTSGWNFRHAHYHEEGRRTLYKAYGIKFVIIVQGRAGAGAVANRAGNVPSQFHSALRRPSPCCRVFTIENLLTHYAKWAFKHRK